MHNTVQNSDKLSFYYYFILSLRIEYVQNQIAFVIENICYKQMEEKLFINIYKLFINNVLITHIDTMLSKIAQYIHIEV